MKRARAYGERMAGIFERLHADTRAMALANALLLTAICLVLVALGDVNFWGPSWPRWAHLFPIVIAAVGTALRRSNIAASLLLSMVAVAIDAALGGSAVMIVIVLDALYNVALSGGRRLRGLTMGLCALATLLIAGVLSNVGMASDPAGAVSASGRSFVLNLLQVGALLGTPLWWGSNVRQRNEIAALAEERIEIERARAVDREKLAAIGQDEAVRGERSRMASDLHDAIASRLSAIAIHSGAALAASPSSPRERAALELARRSSIAALEDMRAMITVLRSEQLGSSDDAAPSPPIEWLEHLTDAARAAGSQVHVHGDVPASLPAALGQAIYRIVQESLTNAAKHAPNSVVELVFDFTLSSGRVLVRNELSGSTGESSGPEALNAGTGLIIMTERAGAFGGSLTAGARGSRWCVQLDVPITTESIETTESRESVLASEKPLR